MFKIIFSTARCSSSRNSLRGITHSITHSHILLKGGATSSFDGIFIMIIMFKALVIIVMIIIIIFSSHHMQVLHTGGQEQELDVLEAGEGKGVDNLVDVDVDFLILVQIAPLWGCR